MSSRALGRARRLVLRLTGKDLFPEPENLKTFAEDMFHTDPVAERFVDEVYGSLGGDAARALLDQALTEGLDSIENPPPALIALFDEFDTVPEWVDPELIAEGERIWRRWGTGLFSVAGGITLEMYTEAAVAKPLSLAGGYAGDNALRRFLETARFWIDVSQPGALLTPGSPGRATAMRVRVMHVWVRRTVAGHPEWDRDRWGAPISQSYQLLTLMGGSVVPAMALWLTGVQTTPREIRVLLHYQRYLGHLLGVRTQWYPSGIGEALRLLAFVNTTRSHDAGADGAELIESFPAAFATAGDRGLARWRGKYNSMMYAAYSRIYMMPWTSMRYDLPNPIPGIAILLLRLPAVTAVETLRRIAPGFRRRHEQAMCRHRENWHHWQTSGRPADFTHGKGLRR
ncbi:oxygenase MpaB family protein [Gordonia sp. ABSL1-1]|uniref:oxygenase MpaB family protein n=1 Tax=Gordonia sp. ABSL1-1 TaxID=3053923 RepID=UPI0025746A9F|nr:oxygenase MpaB family protein [Gordonia sp. ABSL1-1]MDL9937229.1 oxygenase MpaB family protein [Gordonia sp. ABSL1-1]